jgi:hypothetical protein
MKWKWWSEMIRNGREYGEWIWDKLHTARDAHCTIQGMVAVLMVRR